MIGKEILVKVKDLSVYIEQTEPYLTFKHKSEEELDIIPKHLEYSQQVIKVEIGVEQRLYYSTLSEDYKEGLGFTQYIANYGCLFWHEELLEIPQNLKILFGSNETS